MKKALFLVLFLVFLTSARASVLFDANADYVSIADNAKWTWTPVTQTRSLSIYWRAVTIPSSNGQMEPIMYASQSGGNKWSFLLYNNSGVNVWLCQILNSSSSTTSYFYAAATVSANTWYHIVFVPSTAGNCKIYQNGSSLGVTEPVWTDNTAINPDIIYLGNSFLVTNNMYLEHFNWFGDGLTSTEVTNLQAEPDCMRFDANNLCYLSLTEASGSTALDLTGVSTATNGTLSGATFAGTVRNYFALPRRAPLMGVGAWVLGRLPVLPFALY